MVSWEGDVKHFPEFLCGFRGFVDLEADFAGQELRNLEQLLASGDLCRDGDKVKETMRQLEETKVFAAALRGPGRSGRVKLKTLQEI